jgi:hypothetical protein
MKKGCQQYFIAQELVWGELFDDEYQEYLRQSGGTSDEISVGLYRDMRSALETRLKMQKREELQRLEHLTLPQLRNIANTYTHPVDTPASLLLRKWKQFDGWFTRNFGWFFTNGNKIGTYE